MKTISVLFYGYKSKELADAVNTTFKNKSNKNIINIYVVDQTNLSRQDRFDSAEYRHVMWDKLDSRYGYLDQALLFSKDEYFMYVDGAVVFEKDWDLKLIDLSNNNCIVSGSYDIQFNSNTYKFYPSYQKIKLEDEKKTNWINRDFVFMNTSMFRKFPSASLLKYHGFEEMFSLYAAENSLDIIAVDSKMVNKIDKDILEHDYLPFSINHGYNRVIDIFKKKGNVFFNDMYCVDILSLKTTYDFNKLSYLPFSTEDPTYSLSMSLDSKGESRFHDVVKSIY